jgi:hypothetical protein
VIHLSDAISGSNRCHAGNMLMLMLLLMLMLMLMILIMSVPNTEPLEINLKLGTLPYPLAVLEEDPRYRRHSHRNKSQQRVAPSKA